MTNKIWKQELRIVDTQEIEVPGGARFLCAREQGDQVCVWFLCDPSAARVKRTIHVCGTGHNAREYSHAEYIGTAVVHGGMLVWHVFEKI